MASERRRVAVVGGGIAGLAAAHAAVSHAERLDVVVFEASDRVGGKILTTPFAGHPAIDEGADAFLARLPWGTELARAVGLDEQLVSPAASRAAVWWDELHPIPEALLLGLPTEVLALARSSLLSWGGKLRAATEPFRRRTSIAPDSLGSFVRARFGDQVHLRLVDPLVGSIYAADTDRFSLVAVPQIAELASSSRSVLLAGRKAKARANTKTAGTADPIFYTPVGGMGMLTTATAEAIALAGGDVRHNAPVTELAVDDGAWRVDGERFDSVVLACPAAATVDLLSRVAPDSARTLGKIPTADVALVSLAVPSAGWPTRLAGLSGYLVPKPKQQLVTAASFGSQKWPQWHLDDAVLLRVSLGRDGLPVLQLTDEQLIAAAIDEVSGHLGISLQPSHVRISRWPAAFPQYRPHHAALVATATRTLPAGLALAGASYHGIGIPACIKSGIDAAARAGNRDALAD